MSPLLLAENISKHYGEKLALSDFNLHIPKGSIYGLLGPNGAGKTTFIRIINQITAPDTGHILLDGERLQPKHITQIGYMPEERGLYKNMKVGEQAIYLAQLKGLSKQEAQQKLRYWFDKFEISDWWNKKLSELSKGMGQKIQFIVTVLHEPKLLIFDEPFSGFDPVNANLIRDEIIELKNKGATIIFSTHRMESVEEMCDHIALINQSKKILDGKTQSIRHQYKEGKYKVSLEVTDENAFANLCTNYLIESVKTEQGISHFEVNAQNEEAKVFLRELLPTGELLSFSEIIPTMNEVFIKAINA